MMAPEEKKDQVIELLGQFGRWQAILIVLAGSSAIPVSWQILVMTFLTPEVDFICKPTSDDGVTRNFSEWTSLAEQYLPENDTLSKCNATQFSGNLFTESNETCKEWIFDDSFYKNTVITQFDLVCSRDSIVTLSQAIFMLGILFGAVGSGIVSDKFGRKWTLLGSSVGVLAFGVGASFSQSAVAFIILRFLVAAFTISVFTTAYCYCMEIIGGKWSVLVGIGLEYFWALGYALLSPIAYAVPDWSLLQLTITLPVILIILVVIIVPESPRWLLTKGRLDEAEDVFDRAIEINGGTWPDGYRLVPLNHSEDSSASFLDLFRTPNMRKKTLIQYFIWLTCAMVYYGLTLYVGQLLPGGDLYINFFVGAMLEFVAYTVTIIILLYFGRRLPLAGMMIMGGLALFLMLAVPEGAPAVVLSNIGKFGITCAFAVVYLYAAELYPTVLRNTGLGSSSMCGRIGGLLAPVIGRGLGKISIAIPIVTFATCSIVAGLLTLLLPETQGKTLPDSVQEGEDFGKEDSVIKLGRRKTKMATKVGQDNDGFD